MPESRINLPPSSHFISPDNAGSPANTDASQARPSAASTGPSSRPGAGQGGGMEQSLRALATPARISPLLDYTLDVLFTAARGEDPTAQENFRTYLKEFLPTPELQNSFAKYALLKLLSEVKGKSVESLTKALADSVAPTASGSEGLPLHTLIEGLSRTLINQSADWGTGSLRSDLTNSLMKELILKPYREFGHAMEINPYFSMNEKSIDSRTIGMVMNASAADILAPMAREVKRMSRASDILKYMSISLALAGELIQLFSENKNQDDSNSDANTGSHSSYAGSGLVTALAMNIAAEAAGYLWGKYHDAHSKNDEKKKTFSQDIKNKPSSFFGISHSGKEYWLSRWENEELAHKDDDRFQIFFRAKTAVFAAARFHPDYIKLKDATDGIKSLLKPDHNISRRQKTLMHKSMLEYLALVQECKAYKENPSFRITNNPDATGIEFKDICIVIGVERPDTPVDPQTGRFTTSLHDIIDEAAYGRETHSFTLPKGTCTLCLGRNGVGKSMLTRFMTGGYFMGKGEMVLPTTEKNDDKFANVMVFTKEPFFGPEITLRENILINSGSSEQDREEDSKVLEHFNTTINPTLENDGFGIFLDKENGHLKLSTGTGQIAALTSAYIAVARAARKGEHVVLVLDEAANGLNIEASEALQELFMPLKPHMTCFQIAHSAENFIVTPDRLLGLNNLRLVEQEKKPLTNEELSEREKAFSSEIQKRGLSDGRKLADLPEVPVKVTTPHEARAKILQKYRGINPEDHQGVETDISNDTPPLRRSQRIKNRS